MSHRIHRRTFVKQSLLAAGMAAGTSFGAPYVLAERSPHAKLNIVGIGVGGRGKSHAVSSLAQNFVAVCDASEDSLKACMKTIEKDDRENKVKNRSKPKMFHDYREMFDKMKDQFDAVFVATPDHHHAPASLMAMRHGKHVYCEKPLTHSISEAREMVLTAQQCKVATQLGNQARAEEGWRLLCEWIWAGVIGNVQEVHIWADRPFIWSNKPEPMQYMWPQGGDRPAGSDPVPAGLHWDVWLGPAPERPFLDTYKEGKFKGKRVYQPFVWRGWCDFGTGALGDMGCHSMSGTFSALKIEHAAGAELVRSSGDATAEMYPSSSVVRWDIPARGSMPPCAIYWYDGGAYPSREISELPPNKKYGAGGGIFVGDKGKIALHGYSPRLLPESKMKGFKPPAKTIPRCASNHFNEWVTACQGGRPAFSNFIDHGGPLTELVLLGNLAVRAGVGRKVEWDGPNMKCLNHPELNRLVRGEYRPGWGM